MFFIPDDLIEFENNLALQGIWPTAAATPVGIGTALVWIPFRGQSCRGGAVGRNTLLMAGNRSV